MKIDMGIDVKGQGVFQYRLSYNYRPRKGDFFKVTNGRTKPDLSVKN